MDRDEYFIGLDIGTNSVGWAVTDRDYSVLKFNGKSMWGVRLFDEAVSAEERRNFRSARRRRAREKERVKLLQEFFSEEIYKIDETFFIRLNESKYYPEDKTTDQINILFNDKDYKDVDFHNEYPTFYHLRKDLMETKEKTDIRKVYLGLQHIVKMRGHFLFPGNTMESIDSLEDIFEELQNYLEDEFDNRFDCKDFRGFEETLKSNTLTITDKSKKLKSYFKNLDNQQKAILDTISGRAIKLDKIYNDESFEDIENGSIDFKKASFEDNKEKIYSEIGEKFILLEKLKSIYDWSILEEILEGEKYISDAKVKSYDKHREDLDILKRVVKKYIPDSYNEIFKDSSKKINNYPAYVYFNSSGGNKNPIEKSCNQEDLCKYLKKMLKDIDTEDGDYKYIMDEIELVSLLPLQRDSNNSVIPNQVNKIELIKILDNVSKYYPFLVEEDENKISIRDKIIKTFEFKIPYYVGPLNGYHGDFSWIVKKKDEKFNPWNFEEIVDRQASAEKFIKKMTNKCAYIIGADVLAKESILYSKYTVLNEINNIKINGEAISVEIKQGIYRDLFMKYKKITVKRIKDYLKSNGHMSAADELSGIDIQINSSLGSYIDMKSILKEKIENEKMVEYLILWISLFGEDKKILKEKIEIEYGEILSEKEISEICRLKYSGWGRLSRELLEDIDSVDKSTGELENIIENLWKTNNNLMELLSSRYDYKEKIESLNTNELENEKISYETLDDMYLSPPVKRSLWQTLTIVDEIAKIMGKEPGKIFVEVAREHGKNVRTSSRQKQLQDLYKSTKEDGKILLKEINDHEERDFRRNRLYLYYLQMGKCMYTGKPIVLDQLYNKQLYDIDHIYPRSETKDNSLDNLVLVTRKSNTDKSDKYPIASGVQKNMYSHWSYLKSKKLLSDEKYNRLTRKDDLTIDEKSGFIARQLVETRQSSKAAAELLKIKFKSSQVVYVKAGNVSDFRNKFSDEENNSGRLIKVREVNDYHHGKDAYLNIVVGNVYHTKFTSDPINFVRKSKKRDYNLEKLFDDEVKRNENIAWRVGENPTIAKIKKQMDKNNLLVTKKPQEKTGGFFNQQILKKGKGQYPIKSEDRKLSDIDKYGGYNSVANAYFALVEHSIKDNRVRSIEKVPILISKDIKEGNIDLEEYYDRDLDNPKILLDKVLMNSLFEIDGFKLNITGSSGNSYLYANAIQLCIDPIWERYIKRLSIVKNKLGLYKDYIIDEYDYVSEEENLELYDIFSDKLNNTIYSKVLKKQGELLEENRKVFMELNLEEQIEVLLEILQLFQANRISSNLKKIKGAPRAGNLSKSKNVSNMESIYIINQSPTGLFEEKIDLLTI